MLKFSSFSGVEIFSLDILATIIIGLIVNSWYDLIILISSESKLASQAIFSSFKTFITLLTISTSFNNFLSWVFCAFLEILDKTFSKVCMSANISSKLIVSKSLFGSTEFETCRMFLLSKHLTTCTIKSTSLIFDKNLLPNPSPFEAPATKPAISTNSKVALTIFLVLTMFANFVNLRSFNSTILIFGSIVVKG